MSPRSDARATSEKLMNEEIPQSTLYSVTHRRCLYYSPHVSNYVSVNAPETHTRKVRRLWGNLQMAISCFISPGYNNVLSISSRRYYERQNGACYCVELVMLSLNTLICVTSITVYLITRVIRDCSTCLIVYATGSVPCRHVGADKLYSTTNYLYLSLFTTE